MCINFDDLRVGQIVLRRNRRILTTARPTKKPLKGTIVNIHNNGNNTTVLIKDHYNGGQERWHYASHIIAIL